MVRNVTGVLIEVGNGTHPKQWVAEVLVKQDRSQGGVTAPSNGLYLVKVEYDACYSLPNEAIYPSFY